MSIFSSPEPRRGGRPYQVGDHVAIVQGPDRGRRGEVISINPASARPYLVKFNEHWYVHFAEDRLALAPTWQQASQGHGAEADRGARP